MELFEKMKKTKKKLDRHNIAYEIEKIASNGREDLVQPIVNALSKEKQSNIKFRLVNALEKIGTDSAVEALKQMVNDKTEADNINSHLKNIRTPASSKAIREILLTTKNEKRMFWPLASRRSRSPKEKV